MPSSKFFFAPPLCTTHTWAMPNKAGVVFTAVILLAGLSRPCLAEVELGLGPLWEGLIAGDIQDKSGVELLKGIEEYCRKVFMSDEAFAEARVALGDDDAHRDIVRDAVLYQVWAGIEDFTDAYYKVLHIASVYQRMRGQLVRKALRELEHGLSPLEHALVYGGSRVVDAYDPFLFAWLQAVQSPVSRALAKQMEEGGSVPEELLNHYTIITGKDGAGNFTQEPYAYYFAVQFEAILEAVDDWIARLEAAPAADQAEKQAYLDYIRQYRACMTETDVSKLEPTCAEVDVKWMALRGWVQVVHDLESGYGDPLRSKMQPEFSVRLLDSTQEAANRAIQRISEVIQEFFRSRDTPLARDGLAALAKASFGIFYHPYLGGFNMQFRSIGQSVPNRADVRKEYGVKMFFDLVAVEGKQGPTRGFATQVLANLSLIDYCMNATETTVWQTAGHELGHGIYNLNSLPEGGVPKEIEDPFEESRADTTALQVLMLMLQSGEISKAEVSKYSCGWLVDQLRRFPQWGSPTLQGYLMSAAAMWARAADTEFASISLDGRIEIHLEKAEQWLQASADLFAEMLDAEDSPSSAATLASIWQRSFVAAGKSPMVKHLVSVLQGGGADSRRSPDGLLQELPSYTATE